MARRGLTGAAEALALVGFGLLALDLTGGYHAGWFGGLTTSGLLVLVGTVLAVTGALAARWSRGTAVGRLTGAEVVVAVGTALAALGLGTAAWLPTAPSLVLAVAFAAGVTVAAHRLRLATATAGAGLVAAAAWVSLTGYALDRALGHDGGWSSLWGGLEVWPLLAAAAIVAAPGLARRLPVAARVAAVAAGQLLLTVALLAPGPAPRSHPGHPAAARAAGGAGRRDPAAAAAVGADRLGHPGRGRDRGPAGGCRAHRRGRAPAGRRRAPGLVRGRR